MRVHVVKAFLDKIFFIFSISVTVWGTSVPRVSGRKMNGKTASKVKIPIITFGKMIFAVESKSTMKGAIAAPILELASKKQKVAFLVLVGNISEE